MIAIVDYGLGNLKSVKCALDRLGEGAAVVSDRSEILAADGIILPGVGAFWRAMQNLSDLGLLETMHEAGDSGKPVLGICLGLQLFFGESAEHGHHKGLNIIAGNVTRFAVGQKVPHMGWNEVQHENPSPLFEGIVDQSFFYFAHSYFVEPEDPGAVIGSTDYGGRYASAVQKGRVFGVQFHPEKSGQAGLKLLTNFCRLCRRG